MEVSLQQYRIKTKFRLYQSCVVSTLLYGSEYWRMTVSNLTKRSLFHTKNLRRIKRVFWRNTKSNKELLAQCHQESMETILVRRRWRWIEHVLRREPENITRVALHWTPEGKRQRGRPKNTWRITVEEELKTLKHNWGTIRKQTLSKQQWRTFVAALHARRHKDSK